MRLIVAAAPGVTIDVLGRMFSQRAGERFGQPFVTENRGAAAGVLAADFVAKAPADGCILIMTNDQLVVQASLGSKLPI